VRAEEFSNGTSHQCLQELEELCAGASWEEIYRVADDICVFAVTKMETDCDSSWITIGICVGNVGDSSGVGESYPDWCAGFVEVRRRTEFLGFL